MTEQSQSGPGLPAILDRIPQRLGRTLVVATIVYFAGFLWTFTGGNVRRLFIPFQWDYFFTQRAVAAAFEGRWFLYGTSLTGLFINWVILLGFIAGAYFAYVWIAQKKR
jgi:hypothetical protein